MFKITSAIIVPGWQQCRSWFAKSTEKTNIQKTEWNVRAWVLRPEKLTAPRWIRSVNRVCGRISQNHAQCLEALHKQSRRWSCVSLTTRDTVSMCTSESSQCVSIAVFAQESRNLWPSTGLVFLVQQQFCSTFVYTLCVFVLTSSSVSRWLTVV